MDTEPTQLFREAAATAISHNLPFALVSLPGSDTYRIYSSIGTDTGDCFFMSRFGGDDVEIPSLAATTPEAVIAHCDALNDVLTPPTERPYTRSTLYASWRGAFDRIHDLLRHRDGKVVLSRHTSLFSRRPVIDVAMEYMQANPERFGYIAFTQQSGLWYGTTPEKLLEGNTARNIYTTVALAGTRWDTDIDAPWDKKNLWEQDYVRRYITSRLEEAGFEVEAGPTVTLSTGGVQHIFTPIRARGSLAFDETLAILNPTPAVAGMPVDVAMGLIDILESHQRRCYAGVVGVKEKNHTMAYVNLRCAFAAPVMIELESGWLHNIYAGGGIMSDSKPDTEWEELDRKSAQITAIIDPDPEARLDEVMFSITDNPDVIDLPF